MPESRSRSDIYSGQRLLPQPETHRPTVGSLAEESALIAETEPGEKVENSYQRRRCGGTQQAGTRLIENV